VLNKLEETCVQGRARNPKGGMNRFEWRSPETDASLGGRPCPFIDPRARVTVHGLWVSLHRILGLCLRWKAHGQLAS
jgi:hypothetical protein